MRIPKPVVAAFVVVNLLLLAACLVALKQNVKLRDQAANLTALLTPARGTVLPPLLGTDWTGAPQAVVYGHDRRPTLIYTFSKECGYCQENWRAMRSLQALAPRRLRIIYIDTIHDLFTQQYLDESGIGRSALLIQLSPTVAEIYDARAFPQLVLVDRDGRVQWSHVGELAPGDAFKALSLIEHN
ncbi:MAG: hypothetical protein WBE86_08650 [Candidatus Acidiferrales bacterium]